MPEAVAEGTRINRSVVRLEKTDITDIEVDAFVFYAQPDLILGAGFGTAISVRGGPTVQKELEDLAPVAACEAVVSAAGNLKADYIIHAVGPGFQEENIEGKLRTTMLNVLKRAEEKGVERIAFPAMGAGYYGIVPDVCARVMLEVIKEHLGGDTSIKELVIGVLDTPQYDAFQTRLAGMR
ncbi:MAG: macro domain-containing protein [Planctomycetota bacterium]|jgi:O-acetyl-ADP-ribose deacetylase (regulator of RNase III)